MKAYKKSGASAPFLLFNYTRKINISADSVHINTAYIFKITHRCIFKRKGQKVIFAQHFGVCRYNVT